MKPKFDNISLKKISGEALFPVRFHRDDRPLYSSIQNYGVLSPLHLVMDGDKLLILDGSARFKILREMNLLEVPCFMHDKKKLGKAESFLLYLELNHWNREFNLVERALCLSLAENLFEESAKIPHSFWEMIGIKKDIQSIHQYRDVLKLPELVQRYAINHNLPMAVVLNFLKFPKDEIEKLASMLFVLPFNQNKLSEVLGFLYDISKREQMSPVKIIEECLSGLESQEGAIQRAERLRQILHDRRNPQYQSHLHVFQSKVKKLPVNKKTRVLPAPFFEDDYVEINAKVYSQKDLKDLESLIKDKNWEELLKS